MKKRMKQLLALGLLAGWLSHAHIGAVSAPMCAFYHRSLGGFSIVSAQTCPLFLNCTQENGHEILTHGPVP